MKKEVFIIGDSIIKYVNGREVSGNNSLKVRSHHGATIGNFIDYIPSMLQKKYNFIILHARTNDIQNNINNLQKVRKVISNIKKYGTDDNTEIPLSSIIHRNDHDFEDTINNFNRKLENLCKGKCMAVINVNNFDSA